MTNAKLLKTFLNQLRQHGILSSETIHAYYGDLSQFINLINYPLTSIDTLRIEKYYNWLQDNHNNLRTVARKISSLRSFYNFLLFKGLIKNNPFRYIHFNTAQLLFSDEKAPRYFSLDELHAMFRSIDRNQRIFKWRDLVLFKALAGLKIGIKGCIYLKLSQIDLYHGDLVITSPGHRTRICQFSNNFAKILKCYLRRCRALLMGRFQRRHNYLLVDYLGEPLTIRGVEYIFNQIIQASHIDRPVSVNMFKHSRPLHTNLMQAYRKYFKRK